MQCRDDRTQASYDAWKAKQSDDYGREIFRYAEAWADLMEAAMAAGDPLEACAKRTSHDADTEGITGFMYGAAVSVLAEAWIHGEALRQWHNLATQMAARRGGGEPETRRGAQPGYAAGRTPGGQRVKPTHYLLAPDYDLYDALSFLAEHSPRDPDVFYLYVQVIKYALRNLHAKPDRDEVGDLRKIADLASRVLPPLVAAEAPPTRYVDRERRMPPTHPVNTTEQSKA